MPRFIQPGTLLVVAISLLLPVTFAGAGCISLALAQGQETPSWRSNPAVRYEARAYRQRRWDQSHWAVIAPEPDQRPCFA